MIEQVKQHVKALLQDGTIGAFVGLKDQDGNIAPHIYEKAEELDDGFSLGDCEGPGRFPISPGKNRS